MKNLLKKYLIKRIFFKKTTYKKTAKKSDKIINCFATSVYIKRKVKIFFYPYNKKSYKKNIKKLFFIFLYKEL